MLKSILLFAVPLLMLVEIALAGCETHSVTSCADGIVHLYDPNTGEVCDLLDCGGGRAPPKTTVPGCPLYTGTAVRTTSYLSCWTSAASASASATASASASASATIATVSSDSLTQSLLPTINITASSTSSSTILSTKTQGAGSTLSTTATPTSSTQTANVGHSVVGSLMGIAGAAIGAVVLL